MERIDPVAAPAQRLVTMGRVLGAHGVRGALMVASFCEPPRRLLDYSPWWMVRNGVPSTVRVVRGQDSTKGLIVEIEDLSDRDQAAALKGAEIAIERAALPKLRKGQYYWTDLEGLRVRNREGVDLGLVDHLFDVVEDDESTVDVLHRLGDHRQTLLFASRRAVQAERLRHLRRERIEQRLAIRWLPRKVRHVRIDVRPRLRPIRPDIAHRPRPARCGPPCGSA